MAPDFYVNIKGNIEFEIKNGNGKEKEYYVNDELYLKENI